MRQPQFRHNDPENLNRRLRRLPETGGRLVVIEGMYSMFGNRPRRGNGRRRARKQCDDFVDEAHSVGCFGDRGRGIAEAQGVLQDIDFISGTFSKSLASVGGFCVQNIQSLKIFASRAVYMFTRPARQRIFLRRAQPRAAESPICARALGNVKPVTYGLAKMDFDLCAPASPVIAVRRPDEATAIAEWNALRMAFMSIWPCHQRHPAEPVCYA